MVAVETKCSYYEYQQKLMDVFIKNSSRMKECSVTKEDFDTNFQSLFELVEYCIKINTPPYRYLNNHAKNEGILFLYHSLNGAAESLDSTYVELTLEKMRRQRALEEMQKHFHEHAHLMEMGLLDFEDIGQILNKAQNIISIQDTKTRSIQDLIFETETEALERTSEMLGPSTGFQNIDALFGGWEPKRLLLVAAPPHTGKSLLAYNLVQSVASTMPTLFFGLETSYKEIIYKMQSVISHIEHKKVRTRYLANDKERTLIELATKKIQNFKLDIYGSDTNNIQKMREIIHNNYHKYNGAHQFVVIDHVGLITSNKNHPNRNDMMTYIANELLQLRDQYNCTMIVLTQMNREGLRNMKNPDMSHIKDCSTLAENTDSLVFIYREDQMNKNVEEADNKHTVVPFALFAQKNRSTGQMGLLKFRAELNKQRLVPIHDSEYADLVQRIKS